MYDDEEEEAMDSMLKGVAPEMPEETSERESPQQVIGQIKSVVAELQELASKL